MANIREIKKRIGSVQNTAKITRAMEMVAASKMRKAQERALQTRPYAEKMQEVMAHLSAQPQGTEEMHPLLEKREVNKVAVVLMTSDKGLCGGLNANITKLIGNYILKSSADTSVIAVGKKGMEFMTTAGRKIRAHFLAIGDLPGVDEAFPIARIVIDGFIEGLVDQVCVAYPRFRSTAIQEPVIEQLLPIEPADIPSTRNVEYIYEPDATTVLGQLLPRYVEMKIFDALLETIASEQSARMVAMRSATDAAKEMIEDLTLKYNKARQEQITTELLDITAGAAAVKK